MQRIARFFLVSEQQFLEDMERLLGMQGRTPGPSIRALNCRRVPPTALPDMIFSPLWIFPWLRASRSFCLREFG